jgi:hypothetical protein
VEPSRARRAGGTLLAVLIVALLLLLVALASRPDGGGGLAPVGADRARVLLDAATYLFAVFVVLSLAVIVWALWPRADDDVPALPPRRRWALSTLITTLVFIGIAVWLRAHARGGAQAIPFLGAGVPRPPAALGAGAQAAAPPGFDWLAAGIVLVLLAVGAGLAWWFLRPRRPAARTPVARIQEVLDDAIEDVLGEADPRRAVIAAWTRLERVLARSGLPRRQSEAPFEYAARAGAELGPRLGVGGVWLEPLASLFEWARFSVHEVTPDMREQALHGLLAVRDELRVAT